MAQAIAFQRASVSFIALIALAFFALGTMTGMALPRPTIPAAPQPIVLRPSATTAQRPAVFQTQVSGMTCGTDAYVSGDLVGDANPASVYKAMCGSR